MALLLAVAFGLLAYANAGGHFMNMMQPQYNMQGGQMMVPMGNGGCNQGADGRWPAGCEIPDQQVDMEEYLQRQMEQQQYETQAMAEKIRAQFEGLVHNVTEKKQRFVMSLVTEFISVCECGRSSSQIYNSVFVQSAKTLNLTASFDTYDSSKMPYEARTEEEARGLIFGGLVTKMCEAMATYLAFADQVTQRIPAFQGRK